MLEAVDWRESLKTGDTWPQVFRCQADNEPELWVLKLVGRAPAAELAADWIGCTLALHFGIPTPPVEIADVPPEALLTAPDSVRTWAQTGPAFASKYMQNVTDGHDDSAMNEFGPANAEMLGRLFALDSWLEVLDQRKPDGYWNLLYDTERHLLVANDFGKSLTPCFGTVLGAMAGRMPPAYSRGVLAIASRAHALEVCDMMTAMTPDELQPFIQSARPWIDAAACGRILNFLLDGREFVREACLRMGAGA